MFSGVYSFSAWARTSGFSFRWFHPRKTRNHSSRSCNIGQNRESDISSALPEIARLRKSQIRSSSQAFPDLSRSLAREPWWQRALRESRAVSLAAAQDRYRGTRPDITLLMRVSARVPHRPRRSCCPTVCRRCQTFRRVLWGRRLPSHDTALAASRSRT